VLRIRVYDGYDWSAPIDIAMNPLVNLPPVVTASGATLRASSTGAPNERIALGLLITAQDPDGNHSLSQYEITDTGVGGGYLIVDDVVQSAQTPITLSTLSNAYYVAGNSSGAETVSVRAMDGTGLWSGPTTVTMTTVLNGVPVVTGHDRTLRGGTNMDLGDIISSVTDPDGNPVVALDVRAPQQFGGYGSGSGVTLGDPNVWHIYSVGTFGFNVGGIDGVFQVSTRAYDGVDWSDWTTVNVTVQVPPLDDAGNNFAEARQVALTTTPQVLHDWLGYADTVDYYKFTLATDAIVHFNLDGLSNDGGNPLNVALYYGAGGLVPGTPIYPYAGAWSTNPRSDYLDLSAGSYYLQLGRPNTQDTFYALSLGITVNHPPVVTASALDLWVEQSVSAASLFTVSDADNDTMSQYRFIDDGAGGGYFSLNGVVQPDQQSITVDAAGLSLLSYHAADTNPLAEQITLQVYDGHDWSAYESITMTTKFPDFGGNDYPSAFVFNELTSDTQTVTDWVGNGAAQDTNDWYKFSIASDSTVHAQIVTHRGSGPMDLQLYDRFMNPVSDIGIDAPAFFDQDFALAASPAYYMRISAGGDDIKYSIAVGVSS
jgi:hypothetical protein